MSVAERHQSDVCVPAKMKSTWSTLASLLDAMLPQWFLLMCGQLLLALVLKEDFFLSHQAILSTLYGKF